MSNVTPRLYIEMPKQPTFCWMRTLRQLLKIGLAKLLDRRDSHVTTAVPGTVDHIAPEYLSTGQSSEKTDVFGFGILLLELITGLKAVDFGRVTNQKGVILDWVKKLHKEGKLNLMVDKDLENNFDRMELHEMVQVALLCIHFNPSHRPKMLKVLRMLEGDGLAEKWEKLQNSGLQGTVHLSVVLKDIPISSRSHHLWLRL